MSDSNDFSGAAEDLAKLLGLSTVQRSVDGTLRREVSPEATQLIAATLHAFHEAGRLKEREACRDIAMRLSREEVWEKDYAPPVVMGAKLVGQRIARLIWQRSDS